VNCYPFIEAEKSRRRNVKRACELLKVSRSAYYAAREGRPSERAAQDADLAAQVQKSARGIEGPLRLPADPRGAGGPGAAALPQAGRAAHAAVRAAGPRIGRTVFPALTDRLADRLCSSMTLQRARQYGSPV
jgi:hypothetical protein